MGRDSEQESRTTLVSICPGVRKNQNFLFVAPEGPEGGLRDGQGVTRGDSKASALAVPAKAGMRRGN